VIVVAVAAAYLVGAIPVGFLVGRAVGGLDIRRHGSGNIGTTNVLRTLGRLPAALTLVGDVAKGYGAVAIAGALVDGEPAGTAVAAVGAVIGNCWPVYLGFRGGKGVATALGVFLRLMPLALLPAAAAWLAAVALLRYVSLGSMLAAVAVPAGALAWGYPRPSVAAGVAVALIVLGRHRDNIARLLAGTERRLGQRVSA
jgi:glycerol-3-phosphate acyltransferase PlsY